MTRSARRPVGDPPPGHVTAEGSVVGDILAGHRIVRRLRVRGCAAVYRAVTETGTDVVLKTLCVGAPPRAHARFDNETATLTLLDGDVAPELIDTGLTHNQRFLAARWCPGATLRRLAKQTEVPPGRESAAAAARFTHVAVPVAEAFARLHARRVWHGDVSRFNVLVSGDGKATIIDLESALRHGDTDSRLPRKVTWSYAPPELARRGPSALPTPAADQYALAAVLYRQLTGRRHRPRPPESVHPGSPAALTVPARALTGWQARHWPELPQVFATALALDPSRRFPSMATFHNALTQALHRRTFDLR